MSAEGTVMVKDIHPGGSGMFSPGRMTLVDNNLFFFGHDGTIGQYDEELWKTDGTEGGTVKVSSDAITSGGHYPVVVGDIFYFMAENETCLLYTSPSPRDATLSRMPSSA